MLACAIGFPAGAALAAVNFPGRAVIIVILNTMMSLPPVVIGLLVYMLVSNAGPLGFVKLLYTPGAMILAQTILVTPLVAALGRQIAAEPLLVRDLAEFDDRVLGQGVTRLPESVGAHALTDDDPEHPPDDQRPAADTMP